MISIRDQLHSAKESIAAELQNAVEQIHGDMVESGKASLATQWDNAVMDIDISAASCSKALFKDAATANTTVAATVATADQKLATAVTTHIATLQSSADEYE